MVLLMTSESGQIILQCRELASMLPRLTPADAERFHGPPRQLRHCAMHHSGVVMWRTLSELCILLLRPQ